jgi:hypothetical protein
MSVTFSVRGLLKRKLTSGPVQQLPLALEEFEAGGTGEFPETMTLDELFRPHEGRYLTITIESTEPEDAQQQRPSTVRDTLNTHSRRWRNGED